MGTMGRRRILLCLPFVNHVAFVVSPDVKRQSTGKADEQFRLSRFSSMAGNRSGVLLLC